MSLQLFNGANIAKAVQPNNLIVIETATINVKDLDGDLVQLFEDKAGLIPQINPFVSDSTGGFKFYIAQGNYNITVVKGGFSGEIFVELNASGEITVINIETNALSVSQDNHGTLFNIADNTGTVSVTLEAVTADSIGDIVFFGSNTDSIITFIEGVGVTIETPSSLEMDLKYSMCAAVIMSETSWRLMGNLAP